jgi:3',5'-cyclic AMP phosphodiesterase CpdA
MQFSVGHLSDLHATDVAIDHPSQLFNKRFFGWLSWRLRRRKIHRAEVLDALIEDLAQTAPDHLVVTGDLTNLSLESEFPEARRWLERLGAAHDVSIVPGNHDAYVHVPQRASWDLWSEYLASDGSDWSGPCDDPRDRFPTVRVRGSLAVVGVCSALPTPSLDASGCVGTSQLERLEATLLELRERELCRLVSIHHPVTVGTTHARRELADAENLRAVLARTGAELVVHGHNHRTLIAELPGPDGAIPVVGVRSSSDCGSRPEKLAHYHVYEFDTAPASGSRGYAVTLRNRAFDPDAGRFVAGPDRVLL